MKTLLILWVIGLTKCEKLDRTYLPPPGSAAAGGYSEDLSLPLYFSKANYSPILQPGNDSLQDDGLLNSKYPNIALGIDRQGVSMIGSSKFFKNRPDMVVFKNIYNVPTTTSSFDLPEASTLSPVKTYDPSVGPVITVSQGYSSTSSSVDPDLTYDQYLNQQTVKSNDSSQTNPIFAPRNPTSKVPNDLSSGLEVGNIQQPQQKQSIEGNVNENILGQLSHLNNISEVKMPIAYSFETYSTQQVPLSSEVINMPDFYDPINTGYSSKVLPDKSDFDTSITMIAPSKYSSLPPSENDNFGTTNVKPQRIQTENDRSAVILNYGSTLTPEGFAFSFDTSNGIHVDETGTTVNGVRAKGSYSYIGDDGRVYNVEYTADENGFLPHGDHLPTAPPIPYAILRNIAQAEQNKKLGIIDDGSYDDAKYGHDRYQGLMDRLPQNQYSEFVVNQPDGKKRPVYSKTNTVEYAVPTNHPDNAEYNSSNKPEVGNIHRKYPYVNEDEKDLPVSNGINKAYENTSFDSEAKYLNNKPSNDTKNKFVDDIINSSTRLNENLTPSDVKTSEVISPISNTNNLPKEFLYHSGYEYIQPEAKFNENDENKLESQISSIRKNGDLSPNRRIFNKKILSKDFTSPGVFLNSGTQTTETSSPISRKTFDGPIISPGITSSTKKQNLNDGITKPDISTVYNKEPSQVRDIIVPIRMFSTLEPKYATTLKPYRYQSPYTSIEKNKYNIYPSTSLESEYSTLTTPAPLQNSSPLTPSSSSLIFSQTTPTASFVTSTLKPSVASLRPTTAVTSSRPNYTGRVSGLEQVEDSGVSTIKPNTFGQRVVARPGYESRPQIPEIKMKYSEEFKPRFQNLGTSTRPDSFGNPSSTEKVIGEDFSGPKQTQRFDPEYGYYY